MFDSTQIYTAITPQPTPDLLSFHAGSDFNAMETNKALGNGATVLAERERKF
jgi:hypothetical protein